MVKICPLPLLDHIYELQCYNLVREWQGQKHKSHTYTHTLTDSLSHTHTLEVCTGLKLKPEPGLYPRSSDPTRPDPSGTVKFRARTRTRNLFLFVFTTNSQYKKRCCISRLQATVSIQIHKETDSSRLGHFTRQKKKHLAYQL